MTDRVASDHPSIATVRATVARHGGRRRRIELPTDATDVLPSDGVIEVVVEERTRFGRCRSIGDTPAIVGIYATRAAAIGTVDGENLLEAVLDAADRQRGSSVLIDVLDANSRIGLRSPGDTAVYDVVRSRTSSLDDIARDLLDDS